MPTLPIPASLKKRFPTILALIVTGAFFVLVARSIDWSSPDYLTSLDLQFLDQKFRWRGPRAPGAEVIIVAIDDKTIGQLGSVRTFTRDNWAKLVDSLAAAGPRAVGFDIIFSEAETSNPENDKVFAEALQRAGNVVLGVLFELKKQSGERKQAQELDPEMLNLVVEKQIFPVERRTGGSGSIGNVIQGEQFTMNIPLLTGAGASFGFFNFHPDAQGRLRHQAQFIEFGGRLYPSLDLQILRRYFDAPSIVVQITDNRIEQVEVGRRVIPTDEYGRYLVNYNGGTGTHRTVSMIDVMEGRIGRETLENKIAIVGPTSVGLGDIRPNPFDPTLPGVELHANVIDNILHERYLVRSPMTKLLDLVIILVTGLLIAFVFPPMNAQRIIIYSLILLGSFTLFNVVIFVALNWVQSFIFPFLSIVGSAGSMVGYKYLTEERERKRTKAVFQYYLDPHMIEQVMSQPEKLKLGGEKVDLTVLFSDIRGFTSFSEKMSPTDLVHFLNEYFDQMTGIIFKYRGTLDKLIGDAIMAFWGHPIQMHDHPVRAVVTALEMIHTMEAIRKTANLPGGTRFDIGVGLNTGPMVVGNMGSQSRFSYTIMGDNVNLGSRLEGLNKYYGTNILISDTTYTGVKENIFCRELDRIQVKGKSEAVTIYEPLGLKRPVEERRNTDRRGDTTPVKRAKEAFILARHGDRRKDDRRLGSQLLVVKPEMEEIAAIFGHARELYCKGDLDEAARAFDHVLALRPGDGPSTLMKTRIKKYHEELAVTGAAFDPVYKFEEK